MVTLRQLRYFAALARHRHFGRAAEECSVSQPALSVQLRELESTLGVRLVERAGGRVTLTEDGVEIERRARAVLAEARDLVDCARQRRSPLAGRLRLGVIPSIAPYLLPAVLPRLQARFPALDLELRETTTRPLLQDLADGRLDVVLLSLPVDQPGFETMALFEDAFLLAARRGEQPEAVTPADLDPDALLLLEEGHCLREQALAVCRAGAASGQRLRFGASSLATILQMVANGYGATLLPEMAVPTELRHDERIALARFAAPEPKRSIGLAWRRTSPRRTDLEALGPVLAEAGRAVLAEARRLMGA